MCGFHKSISQSPSRGADPNGRQKKSPLWSMFEQSSPKDLGPASSVPSTHFINTFWACKAFKVMEVYLLVGLALYHCYSWLGLVPKQGMAQSPHNSLG